MSDSRRKDPVPKALARRAYRGLTAARTFAFATAARKDASARVFYGGARSGDNGGPLVKVKRLQRAFPQAPGHFNIIYSLSNAPYLSRASLARAKARGTGLVHNQNGVFYPGWYDGDWQAANRRMSHAYHLADHVFWQSNFCRDCADRFLGARDGDGEILFNAVDLQHFAPADTTGEGRAFTFLLTGKIQSHLAYRLEDSIAGLAHARAAGLEANLRIAGHLDATANAAAESAVRDAGLEQHVEILGPYTQADAPNVYRGADAYIMTKHADPCPNTVIEAMACGLPVVYVASGGVPELVGPDAGSGIASEEDWDTPFRPDPAVLGQAMLRVAENRAAISVAARQRAETHFDIEDWLTRHDEIFSTILARAS